MSSVVLKKNLTHMKKSKNGTKKNVAMEKAVLFFGGTGAISKILKANHSNVSQWLYGTRTVPVKHAVKIEKLTKGAIKAKEIRPDIFDD